MMGYLPIEFPWDSNIQVAGEPMPIDLRKIVISLQYINAHHWHLYNWKISWNLFYYKSWDLHWTMLHLILVTMLFFKKLGKMHSLRKTKCIYPTACFYQSCKTPLKKKNKSLNLCTSIGIRYLNFRVLFIFSLTIRKYKRF